MSNNKIIFEIDNICVQELCSKSNVEELQDLCESCSDYYTLIEGRSVSSNGADELFLDVPPGKNLYDKMVLGIYYKKNNNSSNELLGVIDLVKDYPNKNTWFIGLMIIRPDARNKNLGRKVYTELLNWALKNDISTIQLGVLQENKRAYKFWKNIGFKQIYKITDYKIANKVTTVLAMSHAIR